MGIIQVAICIRPGAPFLARPLREKACPERSRRAGIFTSQDTTLWPSANAFNSFWIIAITCRLYSITYNDFAFRSDLSASDSAEDLGLDSSGRTPLQGGSERPRGASWIRSCSASRVLVARTACPVFSSLEISTMKTKSFAAARSRLGSGLVCSFNSFQISY
jgi:hypothetical protein